MQNTLGLLQILLLYLVLFCQKTGCLVRGSTAGFEKLIVQCGRKIQGLMFLDKRIRLNVVLGVQIPPLDFRKRYMEQEVMYLRSIKAEDFDSALWIRSSHESGFGGRRATQGSILDVHGV